MYILFDIGGTKTRIAVSNDLDSFEEPIIIQTPQNFEDGMVSITKAVSESCNGRVPVMAAGGVAASPNRSKTELVGGGPNIKDWIGKPLKMRLEEALGCPVSIENDTSMGGLAQVQYGPAQDAQIAVYLTVSTGVGGCRFVDGEIDKSAFGFEPGWQIIDLPSARQIMQGEDWLSGYCRPGYLMSEIGGACVEKKEGKKPYEITDEDFWEKKAEILAHGVHNIYTMWSPDVIVIGGSMMKDVGIPIERVRHYLARTLKHVFPGVVPRIEMAQFGDEMGLHGAMAYLRQSN